MKPPTRLYIIVATIWIFFYFLYWIAHFNMKTTLRWLGLILIFIAVGGLVMITAASLYAFAEGLRFDKDRAEIAAMWTAISMVAGFICFLFGSANTENDDDSIY